MKTTTVAVLFANAVAVFRRRQNANFYGRRIDDSIVKSATTIMFMYQFFAVSAAVIISMVERLPILDCMFESFSAIGTVGLTLGITTSLSEVSRIILILLMFFGQCGRLDNYICSFFT